MIGSPVATSALPQLCVGTSPLGGMAALYGYDVDSSTAVATIRTAMQRGFRFLDTSNEYGAGRSELRIGQAMRLEGPTSPPVILASKADPAAGERVFDGHRVRESFNESVARLGVERLPVYYLHDPERFDFAEMIAPAGALAALRGLKAEGKVDLIGVATGDLSMARAFLELGDLDLVLIHNRFTLLDRSATDLIDECVAGGVGFINAAPYASGMLAKALSQSPRYQYGAADPLVVDTVTWLHETCELAGVPLAAVALQFSTRDARITSTVVGVSDPRRIEELARNATLSIPDELWLRVADRLG